MAQRFKNGSLVQVAGSSYPVLIVKRYDAQTELYTCSTGNLPSSYKTVVKSSLITQCPPGTVAPKTI